MSTKIFLPYQIAMELMIVFFLIYFSNPNYISAKVFNILKFSARGLNVPYSQDLQVVAIFILLPILAILLFASCVPVIRGLVVS